MKSEVVSSVTADQLLHD